MKNILFSTLLGLSALIFSLSANATTVSCDVENSSCTASMAGTGSPNHLMVRIYTSSFSIYMCDSSSGSCVWRGCTLSDDDSQRYQNMQNTAVEAASFNGMNYGRLYMRWNSSGQCSSLTLYAP